MPTAAGTDGGLVPELDQACRPKTVMTQPGRIGVLLADDDVIEKIDADNFGGFAELAGDLNVGRARRGIAARVIVHADQGGGAFANGVSENLARMDQTVGGCPGSDFDALEQTVFPVEAKRPEFFHLQSGDDRLKMFCHEIGSTEDGLIIGLLRQNSPSQLKGGDELQGLDRANAFQPTKVRSSPRKQIS